MPAQTILVVDDDEGQVLSLTSLLEREGFRTMAARSGSEALQTLDSATCDLVLLDVAMPGMDGFEVCRKIRSNSKSKNVPVIFLSAKASTNDFRAGTKSGGDTYITKPFRNSQLLIMINSLLAMRRH